jgi:hypothetical protein
VAGRHYISCEAPEDLLKVLLYYQLDTTATVYAYMPLEAWEKAKKTLPIDILPDYTSATGTLWFRGVNNVKCRYGHRLGFHNDVGMHNIEFYFHSIA